MVAFEEQVGGVERGVVLDTNPTTEGAVGLPLGVAHDRAREHHGGPGVRGEQADIVVVFEEQVGGVERGAALSRHSPTAGAVGLGLGVAHDRAPQGHRGPRVQGEQADVVVALEEQIGGIEGGAALHLQPPTAAAVGPELGGAYDRAREHHGGPRVLGEQTDGVVALEEQLGRGERGAALDIHPQAEGAVGPGPGVAHDRSRERHGGPGALRVQADGAVAFDEQVGGVERGAVVDLHPPTAGAVGPGLGVAHDHARERHGGPWVLGHQAELVVAFDEQVGGVERGAVLDEHPPTAGAVGPGPGVAHDRARERHGGPGAPFVQTGLVVAIEEQVGGVERGAVLDIHPPTEPALGVGRRLADRRPDGLDRGSHTEPKQTDLPVPLQRDRMHHQVHGSPRPSDPHYRDSGLPPRHRHSSDLQAPSKHLDPRLLRPVAVDRRQLRAPPGQHHPVVGRVQRHVLDVRAAGDRHDPAPGVPHLIRRLLDAAERPLLGPIATTSAGCDEQVGVRLAAPGADPAGLGHARRGVARGVEELAARARRFGGRAGRQARHRREREASNGSAAAAVSRGHSIASFSQIPGTHWSSGCSRSVGPAQSLVDGGVPSSSTAAGAAPQRWV